MADPRRERITDKYTRPGSDRPGHPHPAPETEAPDPIELAGDAPFNDQYPKEVSVGPLVTLEGATASMLDFRFRDGRRRAFPYSYLASVAFDPAGSVVCGFPQARVTLAGRSLARVYAAITSQTAIAVAESDTAFDTGGPEPFVESITIEDADISEG